MTMGSDLMNQITRGEITQRSTEYVEIVKRDVTSALTELITYGARVRPLILEGEQVGWVRPFSLSDKKQLEIWFNDDISNLRHLVQLCTTLDPLAIKNLDMIELNTILKIITQGHLADLSLFPYMTAFVTTHASVNLWRSRTEDMFKPIDIVLPDGARFKQITISDHTRLWANLSTMRDKAIDRTEASINAAIVARSMAGGDAWNAYIDNLQKILNSYAVDNTDTWMNTIDFVSYNAKKSNLTDGFGHCHEDHSTEGLMRELQGMLHGDKHEKLIEQFYTQQLNEEMERQERQQALIQAQRERLEKEATLDGSMIIRTEKEVLSREREIKDQTYGWVNRENLKMFDQNDSEEATDADKLRRLTQYS